MSVSSVASTPPVQAPKPAPPPQAIDKPNDGDSDDHGGGSSAALLQSAPRAGTGTLVDKTA
jgi:hypothetical protein